MVLLVLLQKLKKKKTVIGTDHGDLERRVEKILKKKGMMSGFNHNPYIQPPPMMYPPPYPPQMMRPNYMEQDIDESDEEEDYEPQRKTKKVESVEENESDEEPIESKNSGKKKEMNELGIDEETMEEIDNYVPPEEQKPQSLESGVKDMFSKALGQKVEEKKGEIPITEQLSFDTIAKGSKEALSEGKDALSQGKNLFTSIANNIGGIAGNAIGTVTGTGENAKKVVDVLTNKKCNKDFLDNLGLIIDTCNRDDYVNAYNIILERLKKKKNTFTKSFSNKLDTLEPLEVNMVDIIPEAENSLNVQDDIGILEDGLGMEPAGKSNESTGKSNESTGKSNEPAGKSNEGTPLNNADIVDTPNQKKKTKKLKKVKKN